MKTTVDLPEELLIEAKKRAVEQRRTLRSLIEAGLRAQLRASDPNTARPSRRIRWVTVDGGLPVGLDLSSRDALGNWVLRERAGG